MPTELLAPLGALHRPGSSLQKIQRSTVPLSSAAGVFSVRPKADEPRPIHPLELLFQSPEEVAEFTAWFGRRYGALVPFWVPSYQQDLAPTASIAADAVSFDILSMRYTDLYFPLRGRQSIVFLRNDGTFLKRNIVASVDNDDGTETIEINEALGEIFTQNSGNGICFLWYGRLTDDVVSIEWDTADTASVVLNMTELLDAPIGGSGDSTSPIPDCPFTDVTNFLPGKFSGDFIGSPWTVTEVGAAGFTNWQYTAGDDPSSSGNSEAITPSTFRLRVLAAGSFVPLGATSTLSRVVSGFIPGKTYTLREIFDQAGDGGVAFGVVRDTTVVADGGGNVTVSLVFTNGNNLVLMGYDFWWQKVYIVDPDLPECEENL